MPLPIVVRSGDNKPYQMVVTQYGQTVVAPISYDETKYVELDVINTAYNFYEAKIKKRFVITLIRMKADQNVSNTADADVIVYEATSDDTTTVDKVIHQEAMVRGDDVTMPTNIIVTAGKYINAKTTDDDIHITIMGYYLDIKNGE